MRLKKNYIFQFDPLHIIDNVIHNNIFIIINCNININIILIMLFEIQSYFI